MPQSSLCIQARVGFVRLVGTVGKVFIIVGVATGAILLTLVRV